MKKIKYFLLAFTLLLSAVTATSQNLYLKSQSGILINYGRQAVLTTTDSALNIIDTVAITDNTAGMLEVQVVGYDSVGSGVTGKQIYRYKKVAGTLTLSAATQIMAIVTDTGLGTSTYTVTATASDNVQVKVKGKLTFTVLWRSFVRQMTYVR